jgi:hypothetical protein
MKIVGISGKAQAGKDLTARLMREFLMAKGKKVLIVHFADKLKDIVKFAFNWDDDMVNSSKKDEVVEGTNYTPRWVLQQLGTEFFREKINEDFWVDTLLNEYKMDHWENEVGYDFILIPDVRFNSEALRIKDLGGKIFSVERASLESKDQHRSEYPLINCLVDSKLSNNGSFEWLSNIVEKEVLILLGKGT